MSVRQELKFLVEIADKVNDDSKQYFSKSKPKTETEKMSNNCEETYIGNTTQYLYKRCNEHNNCVKNNRREASASARYSLENLHQFDFENVEMLATELDYPKRTILEMLHIRKSVKNLTNNQIMFITT